ncbi:hypothetical protein J6P92_07750 [bacterium]|nr:hypothetical protein [bacterium]
MSDSMTIGPAMQVGGNVVEMRIDGKIQVTNQKGKIKTLTQDEFKKQTIKNADKIQAGEDFEYKKDHKGLKIAGAAVGTVAVSLGIIYRKEIGKYLKNFSFKKFWQDIKNLFKSNKNKDAKAPVTDFKKYNVYNGERTSNAVSPDINARLVDKETQRVKNNAIVGMTYDAEVRQAQHFMDVDAKHDRVESELKQLFDNLKESDFTTRHGGEYSRFFDHENKPADWYLR